MSQFHLHVDATSLSESSEAYLLDLGFDNRDFLTMREETDSFQPRRHLTMKFSNGSEYRQWFGKVAQHARLSHGIDGYLEGEYVPFDFAVSEKPFNPDIPVPFKISRKRLPPGQFRESEIHVAVHRDSSDPRLFAKLREMGCFTAYTMKSTGVHQIFTIQGDRNRIKELSSPLIQFLEAAGGAVEATVKEERIIDWWLSDVNAPLPPVLDSIEWFR